MDRACASSNKVVTVTAKNKYPLFAAAARFVREGHHSGTRSEIRQAFHLFGYSPNPIGQRVATSYVLNILYSEMEHLMTAADVLVESLIDWGVEVIFGLPGDGINGIMEALRTRQDKIRFVQVRHEESAAFMACAYAKFTGKLGVCLATSGPGVFIC